MAFLMQGIAWAAEAGIVSGYGGGRFGPNDEITREQLAVTFCSRRNLARPSSKMAFLMTTSRPSAWTTTTSCPCLTLGIVTNCGPLLSHRTGWDRLDCPNDPQQFG